MSCWATHVNVRKHTKWPKRCQYLFTRVKNVIWIFQRTNIWTSGLSFAQMDLPNVHNTRSLVDCTVHGTGTDLTIKKNREGEHPTFMFLSRQLESKTFPINCMTLYLSRARRTLRYAEHVLIQIYYYVLHYSILLLLCDPCCRRSSAIQVDCRPKAKRAASH